MNPGAWRVPETDDDFTDFDLERFSGYDAGLRGDETGPPIRDRPVPCSAQWWTARSKELDRHWVMGCDAGARVRAATAVDNVSGAG